MRSKCYLLQKHGFGVQTTINGEEYVGLWPLLVVG
jgi:hypothetical protein